MDMKDQYFTEETPKYLNLPAEYEYFATDDGEVQIAEDLEDSEE